MKSTLAQEADRITSSNLRQEKLQCLYIALDIVTKTSPESERSSEDVFVIYERIKKETGL